jgi:hypothetical protein
MEYPTHGTRAWTLTPRPGFRLVHNHVTPANWQGAWGFRFWWQPDEEDDPPLVSCGCRWAPKVAEHFRVEREAAS